jgi:hypothetical protein
MLFFTDRPDKMLIVAVPLSASIPLPIVLPFPHELIRFQPDFSVSILPSVFLSLTIVTLKPSSSLDALSRTELFCVDHLLFVATP